MRPTTLKGPYLALANAVGGVVALAELVGVSRMTLYRWSAGEHPPSGPALRLLRRIAAERGVEWP